MEQQSIIQTNGIEGSDPNFPFEDATNSFEEPDQSVSTSEESTVTFISEQSPESPSSPSSAGLRHRRLASFKTCKESQFFKNNPDGLIDFNPDSTCSSPVKKLKDNKKLNENLNSSVVCSSSGSDNNRLNDETDASSAITGGNNVDSPNAVPDVVYILAELVIKVINFQTKFLSNSVTFPIWLMHSLYLVLTDPFGVIKLAKSYMMGNSSEILGICYTGGKLVNHLLFKKHESTVKLCVRIGWGLLWFVYCGFILVSLLVSAFLFGGMMMRWIVEEPVQVTEKLTFDYTKDTPTAFVAISSCPESSVIVHNEKSVIGSSDESRVIPFDHEVQATVSLTLPESDYNINLGIFQVRVDFLSSDGNVLASTRQPCMLRFKSQPIRLVSTFLKLASLLTGYSSETQTLDIKFRGYIEKDVHTSCSRVVIEQRAEFARRGGVPEVYSASLKIESRLPFVKRMLWYSKWLIYMWISVTMYIMELLFTLLCCRSIIFPWEQSLGRDLGSSNDGVPHNKPNASS
ncbi:putative Seipin family protein [Helianthus anomalus]